MRVDALEAAIEKDKRENILPMAIVANAGTTSTGAIDPLRDIGKIARIHAIWFHVDGAYGLPGILDERLDHLYRGLEMADSVIVDPHKAIEGHLRVGSGLDRRFGRARDEKRSRRDSEYFFHWEPLSCQGIAR